MPDGVIRLRPDECQALLALGRRQLAWDPRMPVRLRSTEHALGLYTTPPFDVLALFAVPAVVESPDGSSIDATIALASLVTALEVALANDAPIDLAKISEVRVPVAKAMSVAHLPPTEGWHLPINAVSGDVLVSVDEAVAEFARRARGQAEVVQQEIADEIWGRSTWAALPMRMLHAAARLGMLTNDRSRIAASVNGTWKRLSTPRGHVLVDTSTGASRVSLTLLG